MTTDNAKPLKGIGVAITRPSGQATKLTKLIQDAGGHVFPFPLIEIAPLDDYSEFEAAIQDIANIDWIIFISSNAVQNGMPHLITKGIPDNLKFTAIGPVTAEKLGEFGIQDVLIPDGKRFDSESLLSMPQLQNMQGKNVMIIRGIGGRELLANTLKERGATVTFGECYQRINPQQNCDVLEQAFASQHLHQIVVTSSEAMRYLLQMVGDADWLKQIKICVNHARVAEEAVTLGLNVNVASAPGDEAMIKSMIKK